MRAPSPTSIKIYGERNSGTNYLQQLLMTNFEVALLNYLPPRWLGKLLKYEFQTDWLLHWDRHNSLGWKHGKPHESYIQKKIPSGLRIITIAKNPYAYLLSLHRRPYHYQGNPAADFSTFIRQPWKTILRDNCQGRQLANPVALWNEKNRAYLQLGAHWGDAVANITYERLLARPETTLQELSRSLKIKPQNNGFTPILSSTKDADKSYEDYLAYYGNQRWQDEISDTDVRFINAHLDADLVHRLDYRLLK